MHSHNQPVRISSSGRFDDLKSTIIRDRSQGPSLFRIQLQDQLDFSVHGLSTTVSVKGTILRLERVGSEHVRILALHACQRYVSDLGLSLKVSHSFNIMQPLRML